MNIQQTLRPAAAFIKTFFFCAAYLPKGISSELVLVPEHPCNHTTEQTHTNAHTQGADTQGGGRKQPREQVIIAMKLLHLLEKRKTFRFRKKKKMCLKKKRTKRVEKTQTVFIQLTLQKKITCNYDYIRL